MAKSKNILIRLNKGLTLAGLLLAMAFAGCQSEPISYVHNLDEVEFQIDDRRGRPKGKICAVKFFAGCSRVKLHDDVYMGSPNVDVLWSAYSPRSTVGRSLLYWFDTLGPFSLIDNATEEFEALKAKCLPDDVESPPTSVYVIFYWENAFPETHRIPKEVYDQTMKSWQSKRIPPANDDIIVKKTESGLRSVGFEEMKALVTSRQYDLVVAFPDDDRQLVDACRNGTSISFAEMYFRMIGANFPNSEEGTSRFMEHLKGQITNSHFPPSIVRVVIW